jgi:lipoyl(octanoyl) transferase
LRVKGGCTYHGLSLNVDMDLTPFSAINPCGYAGMAVTRLCDLGVSATSGEIAGHLARHLLEALARPL